MRFYLNNGKIFKKRQKRVKKTILTATMLCSMIVAEEFEYDGKVTLESSLLEHNLDNKRGDQIALRLEGKAKYRLDENKKVVAKVQALYDTHDKGRSYFDFADLYFEHNFKNYSFLIGRSTRSWGVMEFYSHVDNFNTKNWLDNPFDFDSKIGAWNFSYSYKLDSGKISLITKMYEEKQKIQDIRSVNRFFGKNYDDGLETSRDRIAPTIYVKYSPLLEDKSLNYSLIFQRGYDEQRYLAPINSKDENSSIRQNAYVVDKVMAYGVLKRGNTEYKTELAYTHSEDSVVSHYAQVSLGLEHTLPKVYKEMDLGVLFEIYEYKAFEKNRLKAIDFPKLFADDMVLGLRVSQNDKYGSELLGGVSYDRHNQEKIYFMKYDTRISDKYKLGVNLQHLAPHKGSLFRDVDSVKVEFGYLF